jgi:hypothetical protein
LWVISAHADLDGTLLQQALAATFARRKTAMDTDPVGLSAVFATDAAKQAQWNAFVRKNKLEASDLISVVEALKHFLQPVLRACARGEPFNYHWAAKGPWKALQG